MLSEQEKLYTPETAPLTVVGFADLITKSQKKEPADAYSFVDENQLEFRKIIIDADMKEVARLQKIFAEKENQLPLPDRIRKQDGRKISEAMEVIFTEKAQEMSWFTEHAVIDKTNIHDDLRNGIDSILTISLPGQGTQRIALAIDVSMRASLSEKTKKEGKTNSIREKMERNIQKVIDPRQRIEVKYFKSSMPDDNHKGKLSGIVPVVVGLEGENAKKLIILFGEIVSLQKKEGRSSTEEEILQKKIQEAQSHPCQALFLREIRDQLEMYSAILKKEGSLKSKLFEAEISKVIPVIDSIMQTKKDISYDSLKQDRVFSVINEVIAEKKK
jgi:hypothetical protein